jgi:hypothetical protein
VAVLTDVKNVIDPSVSLASTLASEYRPPTAMLLNHGVFNDDDIKNPIASIGLDKRVSE